MAHLTKEVRHKRRPPNRVKVDQEKNLFEAHMKSNAADLEGTRKPIKEFNDNIDMLHFCHLRGIKRRK
jgi:hypothetical protein